MQSNVGLPALTSARRGWVGRISPTVFKGRAYFWTEPHTPRSLDKEGAQRPCPGPPALPWCPPLSAQRLDTSETAATSVGVPFFGIGSPFYQGQKRGQAAMQEPLLLPAIPPSLYLGCRSLTAGMHIPGWSVGTLS